MTSLNLEVLANSASATSYRRAEDGSVEHQCSRCRKWLPATPEHFTTRSRIGLSAYCRPCQSGALLADYHNANRAKAARLAAQRAERCAPRSPLAEVMAGVATCRRCSGTHPLSPEFWATTKDGRITHVCLECADELRQHAARRPIRISLEILQ